MSCVNKELKFCKNNKYNSAFEPETIPVHEIEPSEPTDGEFEHHLLPEECLAPTKDFST